MSPRTDTHRGALIALAICDQNLQPQLFTTDPPPQFWLEIHHAAVAACHEADMLAQAVAA